MSARRKLPSSTFACRIMGHRWRLRAEGSEVVWHCARGCGEGGRRRYASPQEALRFAAAFEGRAPRPPAQGLAWLAGTWQRTPRRRDRE